MKNTPSFFKGVIFAWLCTIRLEYTDCRAHKANEYGEYQPTGNRGSGWPERDNADYRTRGPSTEATPVFGVPAGPFAAAGFAAIAPFLGDGALTPLLYGPAASQFHSPRPSFCDGVAAAVRLLRRLLEPLVATGFYVAASHYLGTAVMPRLAHYVHAYLKGVHDARLFRSAWPPSSYGHPIAVQAAYPCLRQTVCRAGLEAAAIPVLRSFQRLAKDVNANFELIQIFKESFIGSISECNQYTCEK